MKTRISTKPFFAFIILGITTILLSLTFQPAMGSSLEEAGDLSCAAPYWPTPAPPDSGGSLDGGQSWLSLPGRETRTIPDYRPVEQATVGSPSRVLAHTTSVDLLPFFCPDCANEGTGMRNSMSDGVQCFYTYKVSGSNEFYITKSCADSMEWEHFSYDSSFIYHKEDTTWATWNGSAWTNARCMDGRLAYSTYLNASVGSANGSCEGFTPHLGSEGGIWVKRYMYEGEAFAHNVTVVGFAEETCTCCQAQYTGPTSRTVKLVSVDENVDLGPALGRRDVIRIAIMGGPGAGENYWYARNYGWIAMGHVDPPDGAASLWDQNHITGLDSRQFQRQLTCSALPTPPPPTTPPPSGTITVSGTVKDTDGNRLAGIWVYFWEHEGAHSAYGLTDSNGHYSLQIVRGSLPYQVVANKDNSDSAHPKNFNYSTSGEVTITPDGNHTVDFQLTPVAATPPPANHAPVGYLDAISSAGVAWGWALDPDTASANIEVHFYLDGPAGRGAYIGSARADLPRPDINRDLGYPGDHGFNFSIPSQYRDGRTHSLYAYGIDTAGGTNPMLSACPKYFTLGSSSGCPPSLTCGRVLDEYGNPEEPPSGGRRVTTAVQPGETRQAENYWGMMGIDYIGTRGRSGMCDPWRIYLFGWHGRDPNRSGNQKGDLAEYLVNFPSASSTYTFNVIGLPDDPKGEDGVLIGIWIDGVYKGRIKWNDGNPACNEGEGGNSQKFSISGYQGVHAVAFEFINDFYEPPFRDEFSRDMFFDYFKFTASASAPPTQPPPTQPPATQPPPTTIRAGLYILHPTSGVWPGMRITQCIENGKQRVWQVSSDIHWANWITDSESQDGYCGSADPTYGILPLIFRDSTYTPGGLVTWCTGASGTRWVWRSTGSYRYVPFAYPENSQGACP
jgi:hypothetical protein